MSERHLTLGELGTMRSMDPLEDYSTGFSLAGPAGKDNRRNSCCYHHADGHHGAHRVRDDGFGDFWTPRVDAHHAVTIQDHICRLGRSAGMVPRVGASGSLPVYGSSDRD